MQKNFKEEAVWNAGKLLQEKKLPVNWFLMFGAPDETTETVKTTITNIAKMAKYWDFVCAGIGIRIYHQTPLSQSIKSSDAFLQPIGLQPHALSLEELELIVLIESANYPNFYIFGPRQTLPPYFITRNLFAWWKKFAPRLPNWRIIIGLQQLEILLGIRWYRLRQWRKELNKIQRQKSLQRF